MPRSSVIQIPEYIEPGWLIGRGGCNIKPISEKTGTSISINSNTKPARIEIKHNPGSPSPSNSQINEAKDLLNNLIEKIDKKRQKRLSKEEDKKKKEKVTGFLDDFKGDSSKYQREVTVKKERQRTSRETRDTIKYYMK